MSEEVNKPKLRPEPKIINRTLILVSGQSRDGKTFLSSHLMNDKIDYISMDRVVVLDTKIEEVEYFKNNLKKPVDEVDKINKFISENYNKDFISNLFKTYIDKCSKKIILIDGHIFSFDKIMNEIKKKCIETSTRLWVIKKENL